MRKAVSEVISRDGTRIAYDVVGEGPPLVLAHGTATTRMLAGAGRHRRLSTERWMVLVDLRGHGASDTPQAEAAYAIDRLVDDVLSVLDAVTWTRPTISVTPSAHASDSGWHCAFPNACAR